MSVDLVIAIPTVGRIESLSLLLLQLGRQRCGLRCEIVVVDNGVSPQTREAVEKIAATSPVAIHYRKESVPGVARARNLAASAAVQMGARWIGYLDDDVVPEPDWLCAVERSLAEHEGAAAIGGRVKALWESPRPSWLRGRLVERLGVFDFGPESLRLEWPMWLSGANMVFRLDALGAAGLFATRLGHRGGWPLSGEEPEVCRRILAAGGRIHYDPRFCVAHRMPPEGNGLQRFLRRVFWIGCAGALIDACYGTRSGQLREALTGFARALRPRRIAEVLRSGDGFERVSMTDDLAYALGYANGVVLSGRKGWQLRSADDIATPPPRHVRVDARTGERWSLTFLINDLDTHGGASKLLCSVVVGFHRAGHDVAVFSLYPPLAGNQYAASLAAEGIALNPGVGVPAAVDGFARALRPLRGVLGRVIERWRSADGLPAEMRMARRLLRSRLEESTMRAVRRRVADARGRELPHLVHVHRGGRVLGHATTLGCPVVYIENSCPQRGLGLDWWWEGVGEHLARVDLVVAGSKHATDAVREYFAFRGEVVALPWIVDSAAARVDGTARSLRTPPVVGLAGRLQAEKGFAGFVRALPLVLAARSVEVLVAGDGACRENLESLAAELGVADRMRFLGVRGDAAMEDFWAAIDVLVIPSLHEGTPLVALEAMARSIPVVATDVGGVRELLRDGAAGLLVPANDPRALADAVLSVLGDPSLREAFTREALDVIRSRHFGESALPLWIGAYGRVVDQEVSSLRGGGG